MDHKPTEMIDTSVDASRTVDLSTFLAHNEVYLVVLTGPRKGANYPVRQERLTLGRGTEADLVFDDETMSRQHAAVEFSQGNFRLRDLDSSNGTLLNGENVMASSLNNGDGFRIGRHEFQFVLEEKERDPHTHVLELD